jgi:PAS domain S-box-containing protein
MEKDNVKLIEEIGLLKKRIVQLEAVQTERDKIELIAMETKELSENIIDGARDPLVVLDARLNILSVNKAFYNTFEVTPDETIGKFIYDLGNRQWDIPKLRKLLEDILPKSSSFDDYVIEHNFQTIGKRIMVLNARRIPRPPAKPRKILLAIEDITTIDRMRLIFEKMAEKGLFTKIAKGKEATIVELKKEVDALLARLNEKLKYKTGEKKS